jgi:hypothetical protein
VDNTKEPPLECPLVVRAITLEQTPGVVVEELTKLRQEVANLKTSNELYHQEVLQQQADYIDLCKVMHSNGTKLDDRYVAPNFTHYLELYKSLSVWYNGSSSAPVHFPGHKDVLTAHEKIKKEREEKQ